MIFKKYPYQDYNAFNLDWVIEHIKKAETILDSLEDNYKETIIEQLTEWLNDGTLADIITEDVLDDIDSRITALENVKHFKFSRQYIISKANALTTISGSAVTGLQAVCYNSIKNRLIYGFKAQDGNNAGTLVECSTDFMTVIARHTLQIGHCNDMSFDEKHNTIYIATGDEGTYANEILAVAADTFTIKAHKNLGSNIPKWWVSYDADKDLVYVSNFSAIWTCDSDLNVVNDVLMNFSIPGVDLIQQTNQASFMYRGQFVGIAMIGAVSAVNGTNNNIGINLMAYDPATGKRTWACNMANLCNNEEPEAVFEKDGRFYMVGAGYRNRFLFVTALYDENYENGYTYYEPYATGARLPVTDLNDLIMPGHYFTIDNAETQMLANIPTGKNFYNVAAFGALSIEVEPLTYIAVKQTVTNTAGYGWSRIYYADNNDWSPWQYIANNMIAGDVGGDVPANSYVDYNIRFEGYAYSPVYMPNKYHIDLTIISGTINPLYADIQAIVYGVQTQNGFTIRVFNNSSTTLAPYVQWRVIF